MQRCRAETFVITWCNKDAVFAVNDGIADSAAIKSNRRRSVRGCLYRDHTETLYVSVRLDQRKYKHVRRCIQGRDFTVTDMPQQHNLFAKIVLRNGGLDSGEDGRSGLVQCTRWLYSCDQQYKIRVFGRKSCERLRDKFWQPLSGNQTSYR